MVSCKVFFSQSGLKVLGFLDCPLENYKNLVNNLVSDFSLVAFVSSSSICYWFQFEKKSIENCKNGPSVRNKNTL